MNDYKKIVSLLNDVRFKGYEDIMCGDALLLILQNKPDSSGFRDCLSGIRRLLKCVLFNEAQFNIVGNPDTLFLFSNSYRTREDHLNNFNSLVKISKNHIEMVPGKRKLKPKLRFLKNTIKWYLQIKEPVKKSSLRLYLISCILEMYSNYYRFFDYSNKLNLEVNKLVSFCDVHAIDCFFTQMFNKEDKLTCTLQHGVFTSEVNSWAIEGSRSRYFLASNQFTCDEAKLLKYSNTMILAGMYSYVGKKIDNSFNIVQPQVIGVYLDSENNRRDNILTIKMVVEYINKYGKRFAIKFHPSSNPQTYRQYIRQVDSIMCCEKGKSVIDFCKEVDLVIARNSTTLIESLQYGIPAYIIYSENQFENMFKNVKLLKFSTAEEFHEIVDIQSIDQIKIQLEKGRSYFCYAGDITSNYINVFRSLGIN